MMKSRKTRLAIGLALTATMGTGVLAGSASADPTQLNALVVMGSDTTQDVVNALSGFNFGINYTAINSGAATNFRHIISFDAAPSQSAGDNCVTPIINGPTFTRPNGSGSGRKALYAASGLSSAGWTGKSFTLDNGTVLPLCAPTVNISGTANFARSSALGTGVGSDVVFVPFARDAMTFASYRPGGGAPVVTLTRKQLIDAFDNSTLETIPDPDGSGTLTLVPCGIQTGSGTHQFWRDTVLQSTVANEGAATATCTPTEVSRLQESKGDLLKIKGDALDATLNDFVVIVGYSAAAYIAQANGASAPNGFDQVQLGSISDDSTSGTGGANLGSPIQGTGTNLTPNPNFYVSAGHGRDVYNVVRRSLLMNTGTGVLLTNAYVAIFADADPGAANTSVICQTGARIQRLGFAEIANCGNTALSQWRAWETGTS